MNSRPLASSAADIIPANYKVSRTSDLIGRPKKELSCLERAWEAIKNFFSSFFCCCRSTETKVKISTSSSTFNASSSGIISSPVINKRTTVPTKPLVSSPKVEEKKKEPSIVKTPPPKKKKKLYDYEPLNTLANERKNSSLLPVIAIPKVKIITKPEGFPHLETTKIEIEEAAVKIEAFRQRNHFLAGTKGLINQILEKVEHPCQVELVFKYAQEHIDIFKKRLSEEKLRPIETDTFFDQFDELKAVVVVWNTLLEISQKSHLDTNELEQLAKCADELPTASSDFYTTYPAITKHIKELVKEISAKPILENTEKNSLLAGKAVLGFGNKLSIVLNRPISPQDALNQHIVDLLRKLHEDIFALFQLPLGMEEKIDLEAPQLKHKDLVVIFGFINTEIDRINKALESYVSENKKFGLDFKPLEAGMVIAEFLDMQALAESWGKMEEMMDHKNGIDTKIECLASVANTLPDVEDEVWKKYPRIKDGMGVTLLPLGTTFFSNYKLSKHNLEDEERIIKIDSAFETMAKKLGCKDFKKPEIVMDTTEDVILREAARQEEYALHARQIEGVYSDLLLWSVELAPSQTAANFRNRLRSLPIATQKEMARGIHQELTELVQFAITPHLTDLLFD